MPYVLKCRRDAHSLGHTTLSVSDSFPSALCSYPHVKIEEEKIGSRGFIQKSLIT